MRSVPWPATLIWAPRRARAKVGRRRIPVRTAGHPHHRRHLTPVSARKGAAAALRPSSEWRQWSHWRREIGIGHVAWSRQCVVELGGTRLELLRRLWLVGRLELLRRLRLVGRFELLRRLRLVGRLELLRLWLLGRFELSGPSDVSAIAKKVDPGLVDIDTTLGYQQEEAAGTGIVLTSSGEVVTNNHVIDGATTISVTDVGNGKTYSASVVGYNRTKDIAVLQLHGASGLNTATIGNSSSVSVGEDIVGIGNAGGTGGTPSAAGGTVTALNQSITASDEGDATSEQLTGLIETNADIQPGDSGGSLVDTSGEVLGIDTAASAGFSFQSSGQSSGNQGYAIPINEAITIAQEIEAGSSSSTVHIGATAFLGVEVAQGTCTSDGTGSGSGGSGGSGGFGFGGGGFGNEGGSGQGSGTSSNSGALICSVITSSPAQEGGLAQGDTITSVNGQSVTTPSALTNLLEPFHPGDKVTIGYTNSSGNSETASVQLSSGPPQ